MPRRAAGFWIGILLAAGALLAVALLVQTIVNYQYVSTNLIRQQVRRTAEERLRNVERSARLARPQTEEGFQAILDELRTDLSEQIASLALLHADGTVVAASGQTGLLLTADDRRRFLTDRDAPFERTWLDGREVYVGLFPCRCNLARDSAERENAAPGRLLLEVALYRDSLSAPFARLRRHALISASAALALLVSVVLIAARFRAYVRGKELEAQAEVARQVQSDLLPAAGAWPAHLDVGARFLPASQVGGDFYDVVQLPAGRIAFALGDVSGHGISAALLMGVIHGAMSSPPWGHSDEDPASAAGRLNALLLARSSGSRYASLFWCAYDPSAHVVRYINAGHPPPFWIRPRPDGSMVVDRLTDGGPVLGLLNAAAYTTASVESQAGDLLVMFSDGIVEAANARGEFFGEERLVAIAKAQLTKPASDICAAILEATNEFTGAAAAQDDRTLLVVRL